MSSPSWLNYCCMTTCWGPGDRERWTELLSKNWWLSTSIIYYLFEKEMTLVLFTTCCLYFHNSAEDKVRQQHITVNTWTVHISIHRPGLSSSGSRHQSGERWAGRHCQRQDTADIRSVLVNILFIKLSPTTWLFCCMLSWAVLFNHICLHCISSW